MESYRRLLLGPAAGTSERRERVKAEKERAPQKPEQKPEQKKSPRPCAAKSAPRWRRCAPRCAACEARVEKIARMLAELDARLADTSLYKGPPARIEALQKKRAEIARAQKRAEDLWLAASARLEEAEAV